MHAVCPSRARTHAPRANRTQSEKHAHVARLFSVHFIRLKTDTISCLDKIQISKTGIHLNKMMTKVGGRIGFFRSGIRAKSATGFIV